MDDMLLVWNAMACVLLATLATWAVLSPRVRHAVDLQNQELRCELAVLEQS